MSYIGRGIDQIDNISTLDNLSFNGSDATYNLTQNSVAFVPVSADALQIQIDGVIQSGNYTVSGSTVTFDFTPSGSSVCNGIKHFGVGVLTTPSDGSVNMAQLGASGTKSSSTFLAGDNTFKTVSSTTINNNADNRVITGSGTANTLEGEANLTYNGTILGVGGTGDLGTGIHVKTNDTGGTVSGDADELVLEGSAEAGLTILGTNSNRIFFGDASSPAIGWIRYFHNDNHMDFGVNDSERMRIGDGGDVLVNTNSRTATLNATTRKGYQYFAGNIESANNAYASLFIFHRSDKMHGIVVKDDVSGGGTQIDFLNNSGSRVGAITHNGSNTSYLTSSDYRLKENVADMTDATTRLKQLKPKRFSWISDESNTMQDGFIAHEVLNVIPEAVDGTKDAMMFEKDGTTPILDDEGNQRIAVQNLDHSKLVPLLTKALQEAITKIETLETENTDIKARLTALENA